MSMTFKKKLGLPRVNHEKMYKLIMDLKTPQKLLLETFYYNNKNTRKVRLMMVIFFLSGINLSIFLPFNSAIYIIGNESNILCPRCNEQDESPPTPHFNFYCKLSKITLD